MEPTYFSEMADELSKHGYERRWEKCRDKITKLKQKYKELVDNNSEMEKKRKMFKFYKEMDAVLGHRPATKAPAVGLAGKPISVLDSGEESDVENEESRDGSLADAYTNSVLEVSRLLFSV